MRLFTFPQRSPAWYAARNGVITASRFKDALDMVIDVPHKNATIDKKTGEVIEPERIETYKPGAKRIAYRDDLVTERITGDLTDHYATWQMKRGVELEPEALKAYESVTGFRCDTVGFTMLDDLPIGASPDGFVSMTGMLEIKCPASGAEMVKAWTDWPAFFAGYEDQVRGQMWIAEREWCDLVVYHPKFPLRIVRIEWDEEKQNALRDSIVSFADEVAQTHAKMVSAFSQATNPRQGQ